MVGTVGLCVLRGRPRRDDEPVEHELRWADLQVRSGQTIQREPPVVSDPPSSEHNRPAATRSRPERLRGSRRPLRPQLAGSAVTLANGIGISLQLSP